MFVFVPYFVNFLIDLCHSLANFLISFLLTSFQNTSSYFSLNNYLISAAFQSSALSSTSSIILLKYVGVNLLRFVPFFYLSSKASFVSSKLHPFIIYVSIFYVIYFICPPDFILKGCISFNIMSFSSRIT